jgi:SAM-dependent methyltransferase
MRPAKAYSATEEEVTFSQEWDQRYLDNTHMSIWPWSDLVSLVYRYGRQEIARKGRVLELGCGAGANIPLFRTLGMDYHALEGSPSIVQKLKIDFPEFSDNIQTADFTTTQPFEPGFGFIIDRASLTHNSTEAIERALTLAYDALAPGGLFLGVDWFSTKHSDFKSGEPGVDPYTRTNFRNGQFSGVGNVHFSDEEHLLHLFRKFSVIMLEEKIHRHVFPRNEHQFSSWIIVAEKK